ncbi:tRNA (uracil-O(2))-methyltransferase [Ceratobasidium sp. AG-Ba]|nr:tRNA (uracil-O(2))-methyltransferase [Ceratobasidium sp. AG-Ba]
MSIPKSPFKPHVYAAGYDQDPMRTCLIASLRFENATIGEWTSVASSQVGFSVNEFSQVIDALVHHPERNSALILRADIESDIILLQEGPVGLPGSINALVQHHPTRLIRRILCPRQPKRDRALSQSCTFYATAEEKSSTVLVLSPDLSDDHPVPPFYHPAVRHLAIRYIPAGEGQSGEIVVDVVRLSPEDTLSPRLVKTCVSLLEGVCRVGYGYANGYRKRVEHDVDRAEFQDLYLQMKDMYGGIVESWQEATDPAKHVFEDIGIATFLILLWKNTYQVQPTEATSASNDPPWSRYPRPPGGFRDIGCGNGLLTHILVASGYDGVGIDLRERKSWSNYPAETQACLKVAALDFTTLEYNSSNGAFEGLPEVLAPSKPDDRVFLIGNHADELTPWMPLVAHACRADFVNIPCCFWGLDERFQARKTKDMPGPSTSAQPSASEPWELALADRLHSVMGGKPDATSPTKQGGAKQPSQYGRYMLWIARLQKECGFEVEVEALRIPSTRNWAFVGRAMLWNNSDERAKSDEYVDGLVRQVRQRGLFKTRVPEGKEGGFITIY